MSYWGFQPTCVFPCLGVKWEMQSADSERSKTQIVLFHQLELQLPFLLFSKEFVIEFLLW